MANDEAACFAVVGAGVIGLSTAHLLVEAGHRVVVFSPDGPFATTSMKAAANFKPHAIAYNDLAHEMAARSWVHFQDIADSGHEPSGVRLHRHWEASMEERDIPEYSRIVQNFRQITGPDVPGGYRYGWRYETFFIDMTVYIRWLVARLTQSGVVFRTRLFSTLRDFADLRQEVIFNCTGLGAGQLCSDIRIQPVKGQVALIDAIPGMDWSVSADGFYIYPRQADVVLGGTAEHGVLGELVDPEVVNLIIDRNRRVLPDLDIGRVLRTYAGTRPFRSGGARLQAEELGGKRIVHSYGHGGSGVTLSWGAAEMALGLI